ncbi:hypothetical protein [Humibacter sp.]|jgi:hypothetical protein|uniref:hypothetical protein n=1 Tax=Humibacter sp. TaxID=1940291 RepID=UPI002CA66E64|nr:hypothetical protein [Humibacter sp.]HVX08093.1 hypothetical protein [Humibacter sp.]
MNTTTTADDGDVGVLGLRTVLVGSLPPALLTAAAPDRYTVEAVFTRRPQQDEVAEILGNDTRSFLSEHGHPTVELTVSDRRLGIANTNLQELRDGLASLIAVRLADISAQVKTKHVIAAAQSKIASELELDRAAEVVRLAESVDFSVPSSPASTD